MPHLIVTGLALADIERFRRFLAPKSQNAWRRAARKIRSQLSMLTGTPEMGRPSPTLPDYRELVIDFGDSGYVARYRYDKTNDIIWVVALWHQREAGY